jgi:hypothetical protein
VLAVLCFQTQPTASQLNHSSNSATKQHVLPQNYKRGVLPSNMDSAGVEQRQQGTSNGQPPAVERSGYAGFGSFMVDRSVEDMITEPASTYSPPPLPFTLQPAPLAPLSEHTPLGAAIRPLFMIDFNKWTFINHGAFGGVCVPAHQEAQQWREHCERQPLRFIDRCVLCRR